MSTHSGVPYLGGTYSQLSSVSSIGGAPWQQDEFQQARQDVDRLAAELRAKEERLKYLMEECVPDPKNTPQATWP